MKINAKQLSIFMAIAALAAALLSGCGGGGGDSTTAASKGSTAAETEATTGAKEASGGKAAAGSGKSSGEKGSGGEGSPGAAPSKGESSGGEAALDAAFVKQANAVCTRVTEGIGEDVEAYEREHKGDGSPAEVQAQAFNATVLPRMQEDVEQLGALASESGHEEQLAPLLEALESALGEGEPESTSGLIKQFAESDALAAKLGLSSCSVS
jgi:hypothetical protein